MDVRAEHLKRLTIVAPNDHSTNRGLLDAAATLGLDALVLPPEEADLSSQRCTTLGSWLDMQFISMLLFQLGSKLMNGGEK
jgi:hypothetical protein